MFLGQCLIPVQENYNQLGVIIDHKYRRSTGITEACNYGCKSYHALSNLGAQFLNPKTLLHLYKTVVLHSALFGCELRNCLSSSDLQNLNTPCILFIVCTTPFL